MTDPITFTRKREVEEQCELLAFCGKYGYRPVVDADLLAALQQMPAGRAAKIAEACGWVSKAVFEVACDQAEHYKKQRNEAEAAFTQVLTERDTAIERAEKAERERDELERTYCGAEREVERLRGVCRGAYAARDIAEHDRDEMRKERDEARGQSYRAHGWKFNRAAREYAQGAEPSEPDEADVPKARKLLK
jgi:hypothetical protein